jgi:hypothetical protein
MRNLTALPWLAVFGFQIAVILAQMFPVTGVILMLFAAPLWSIALVNLGLILMALDGLANRERRWIIAIPAGVYLLNLAFWGVNQMDVTRFERDIAQKNSASVRPLDPVRQALAVDPSAERVMRPNALDFFGYVKLPVLYLENPNVPPQSHIAHRLVANEDCRGIQRTAGIRVERFWDRNTGTCILGLAEDPALPAVTLSGEERRQKVGFGEAVVDTVTATNGAEASFGFLTTLPPIPMPIMGCSLISSQAKWQCVFTLTTSRQAFGGDAKHALAQALGLQARLVGPGTGPTRFPGLPSGQLDAGELAESQRGAAGALAAARSANDDEFRESLALLPRLVSDPTLSTPPGFFWSLTSHADQLGPHADELADDLEHLKGASDSIRGNLALVVAALPDEDFARVGPRALEALRDGEALDHAEPMLVRLGDLGPSAIPVLLQHMHPSATASAMLGLCRIGQPAAAEAADAIVAFARSKPDYVRDVDEVARAGYVAEMRMGRPDLAKAVLDMSPKAVRRLPPDAAQISPGSPAKACRTGLFGNGLADVAWLQPDRGADRAARMARIRPFGRR